VVAVVVRLQQQVHLLGAKLLLLATVEMAVLEL
jgi:hypothetical protein